MEEPTLINSRLTANSHKHKDLLLPSPLTTPAKHSLPVGSESGSLSRSRKVSIVSEETDWSEGGRSTDPDAYSALIRLYGREWSICGNSMG